MIWGTCPDTEQLHRLLSEQLDPQDEADFAGHIERCEHCHQELERLTSGWAPPRHAEDQSTNQATGQGSSITGARSLANPEDITRPSKSSSARRTDPGPDPCVTRDLSTRLSSSPGPGRTDEGMAGPSTIDPGSTASHGWILHPQAPARPGAIAPHGMPAIPGYEPLETLGAGGMGVVYLARQTGLNRRVAVKMIRGGSLARPDRFARFRIEAEAVARLRHPNIIQIHEIGEVDGLPFVSLELLEGGSLADRLEGTPQPARQTAELLMTLASAIQVAHDVGIVHRDLKPSNVLFTEDGTPIITDFGLAKRIDSDSRQTETGQIVGSPSYMAPEQARGHTREVGPAADVYALGAILYEMLTGRPPFKGETPMETVRQVIDDEVVPPSRLVPKVDRDLETICLKCLSKEPPRRYASASELAADLDRHRKGESIHARRASPVERGAKWARRRPAAAALLALGLAAFLGLTVGGAFYEHNRRVAGESQSQHVVKLLKEANGLTLKAREANTVQDLSQVQLDLSEFLGRLSSEDDPRLETLPATIKVSLEEVDRKLRELSDHEEKEKQPLADRQHFQDFLAKQTQAQFHAAGIELDAADSRGRLRDAARAGLAIYAQDRKAGDERWSLVSTLPEVLGAGEKTRIAAGCYDLLLLLSDAVEPASGLRILDRAPRLRPQPTAAYHLRRAGCLARLGDAAGQKREQELASNQPAATALDHFLIGREQLTSGRWSEAIASLETSLRLDPDQTPPHFLLARAYFNVEPRRLHEAENSLDLCIKSHRELVGLYLMRALVEGELGNQALSRIDPRHRAEQSALRKQAEMAFQAAQSDYATALGRQPADDFRYVLLVNRGGMYLQAGNFAASLADLEAAIRLNPQPYQAYLTLAQLHQRRGQLDLAYRAFGQAIDRVSDPAIRAATHRSRALLHSKRRDASSQERAAALLDLAEAIRLEPGDPTRRANDHVECARLYFGDGQHEKVLGACGQALALVPDLPLAHQFRISALMALKQFDEVIDSCDAYLAREQPTIEVLEIRGLARVDRQRYSSAIADYTHAIELRLDLDPATKARLLDHRGWAYQLADAPRLALDDFAAALELTGDHAEALAGRGLARIRLGDWRAAVADAEASVRLAQEASRERVDPEALRQAYLNAARIYSLAVEFAASDVSREGERAVSRYRSYRTRALDLLQQALKWVPESERARLREDPALRALGRVGATHQIMH